jgi:hypothetical protein
MTAVSLLPLLRGVLTLRISTAQPPSVYWVSSPTHANETLMVAGAGLGGVHTTLCADRLCRRPIQEAAAVAAWEQSLQMVLPVGIKTPAFLQIARSSSSSSEDPPLTLQVCTAPREGDISPSCLV